MRERKSTVIQSEATERRMLRTTALSQAWDALQRRPTRPAFPDLSDCNNAVELEWAKLGGVPAQYRALASARDEQEGRVALSAILDLLDEPRSLATRRTGPSAADSLPSTRVARATAALVRKTKRAANAAYAVVARERSRQEYDFACAGGTVREYDRLAGRDERVADNTLREILVECGENTSPSNADLFQGGALELAELEEMFRKLGLPVELAHIDTSVQLSELRSKSRTS